MSTNAYQRADDVKIFPNLVSTELNIESSGLVSQIEIYDITGRLNFSVQINGLKGTINTVSLKSGMYLLKVISSEKSQTFKLEKK